ncbi:hypothetical protein HYO62_01005 [Aerococcaceae bacterium DSM 111022]|nr:hypothetical protein [Aerococcaceae bacterium DSM 111022]
MLSIKRNTGFSGSLSKINIYINDEKVARIKQNQQIDLELPSDTAKIHVTQGGVHSNELVVKEGQVIEITNSSWFRIYYPLLFISFWLIAVLIPHTYKIIVYITILIVTFALTYFKNGFDLKVIYP